MPERPAARTPAWSPSLLLEDHVIETDPIAQPLVIAPSCRVEHEPDGLPSGAFRSNRQIVAPFLRHWRVRAHRDRPLTPCIRLQVEHTDLQIRFGRAGGEYEADFTVLRTWIRGRVTVASVTRADAELPLQRER